MPNAYLKIASLSLLLLPAVRSANALDDEKALTFGNLSYPIRIELSAAKPRGAVLFESAFSENPFEEYDTLLLQGEMPDPNVRVEVVAKSRSFLTADRRYQQLSFRRFPNGRFWARYKVGALSRQPLKLVVINQGLRSDSTLTLYGSELRKETMLKEEPETPSAAAYIPDPALSLPANAPFALIRRAQWKALPPKAPFTRHGPRYFTLHHTQGTYPKNLAESTAEIQFVQDYHQNGRGWIDIGYHFMIDPQGNIFEGRPIRVLGAHVSGRNTGNVGISIMGNYHPPVLNQITAAEMNSFVSIGRYLKDTYEVNRSSFYAHRDIGTSDCPGDGLYAKMEYLRDLIFTQEPRPVPVDTDSVPPLSPAQRSALDQLIRYLDQN